MRTKRRLHPLLWLVGLVITLPLSAEVEHKKIGKAIPDVQLRKSDGTKVGLHDEVASQPAVVVFYRGGWCPYCSAHLAELGRVQEELREIGFQILAISPDRPEKLRESMARVAELASGPETTYTLLSDSKMIAAQAFGIAHRVEEAIVRRYRDDLNIDLEDASGETHHLLPHPAVFVVTRDKIIRFAHIDTDYKARLSGAEILSAAREARTSQ